MELISLGGVLMGLKQKIYDIKFDKRLIEFNLKNSHISPSEYKQFLKELEDLSQNSNSVTLDEDEELMQS